MLKVSMLLVLAAALAACGHPAPPATPAEPAAPAAPAADDDPSCPVLVPGTSVAVEDLANGAALVFVTTGDAAAVRKRASALADMHTRHDGPASAMGMMISTASKAVASDVDHGAKVEFVATKPDDIGALQSELRMHAQHLANGTCKMAM